MRTILISLDAAYTADADRLFRLPALCALRERGVLCTHMQTVYPTLTYPIHTSLITGCYPSRHGIAHNEPFQPDTAPDMRAWYWEASQIKEKTLWHAAKEKGLDVASVLWPVSGKCRDIRRNFPEILPLPGENATLKMLRYGTPVWILWQELLHGKKRKSINQPDLDAYAALLCENLILSKRPPDFLTVHFVDLDAMRHRYGVFSNEAQEAMVRLDGCVARIVAAIKRAGLESDTAICVVSDHGQRDIVSSIPLDAILREKIGARAQSLGMGAYIFAEDVAKARVYLDQNKDALQIEEILDEVALKALNAPKGIKLAVSARDKCEYVDGKAAQANHGFSLTCEAAQCLLLLSGAPFKAGGMLNSVNVVDVAPTLAKIMDVDLRNADGRVLSSALKGEENQ